MVLALMMALVLVPAVGLRSAQAAAGATMTINATPKNNYIFGAALDLSGLRVTIKATNDAGNTAAGYPVVIEDYTDTKLSYTLNGAAVTGGETLDETSFSSKKKYELVITYTDGTYTCKASYYIRVGASAPSASISVLTAPQKEFVLGGKIDLSGLILTATHKYSNGNVVEDYPKAAVDADTDSDFSFKLGDKSIKDGDTLSAADFKEGTYTLTVYYSSTVSEDSVSCKVYSSATISGIRISKSVPTASISVKTPPKVTYVQGQKWDLETDFAITVNHFYGNGDAVAGYPKDIESTDTDWQNVTFLFDGHVVSHDDDILAKDYSTGTRALTIVYTGKVTEDGIDKSVTARTTISITISEPTPKAELTVVEEPDTLYYVPGASLDLTGLKLRVQHYLSNGDFVTGYSKTEIEYSYPSTDYSALNIAYTLGGKAIAADGPLTAASYTVGKDYPLVITYTGTVTEGASVTTVKDSVTLTVHVVKELLTGVAINSDPDMTTFFIGEKLDLTGLAYSLLYTSKPSGATSRTDTTKKLSAFELHWKTKDGALLSLDSPMTFDETGTFEIYAGYPDTVQNKTAWSAATLAIEVLDSPTALSVANKNDVTLDDTVAKWEYDASWLGKTVNLEATTTIDGNPETDPSYVSWGSSNPSVATVSTEGDIKLLAIGETTITVRTRGNNQIAKSFKVIIAKSPIPLTGVQLNKTDLVLTVGSSDKLTASLVPSGANYKSDQVEWTVKDKDGNVITDVVEVTPDADNPLILTVKALSEGSVDGKVVISVKVTDGTNDFTASCAVEVNVVPVERVYVSPTAVTLMEGESYQITGTVLPYDATDTTLSWLSSNVALATVQDGKVTVKDITDTAWKTILNPATGEKWTQKDIDAGNCYTSVTISCVPASNTKVTAATCTVTIKQGVLVTQMSLNKYSAVLAIGGTTQLSVTVLPTNATIKTVTWSSSDPTIATVSSTGKVTGMKAGTCKIFASSNGSGGSDVIEECQVTVNTVSTGSIGLNALNLTLYHDQTATLVATIYPTNATNKDVTFTSSKTSVATVDASSGLITAVGNGKTTITVTANDGSGATASCLVSVMDKVSVTKITLNMSDFSLLVNDTTTLTATVIPDYASETEVTWSSSNPAAASVDENGKVSGLVAGQSAIITATAKDGGGVTASVSVDVVATFYGTGKVVNCVRRVNVRALPSGQATFKGYAYLNSTYKVLGKTGNWYKISYNSETCYIWAPYIRLLGDGAAEYTSSGTASSSGSGTTTTPTKCTITNCIYAVNVRSGPGTTYDKLGIAALNTSYTYLGTYGDWYKLQFNATTEGYIHANYISVS